jgi:phenylacetate-coenzyme A ligase PaaK-like adenylate-forming protein
MRSQCVTGFQPCLTTYASSAVRICQAARDQGIDLSGAAFTTIGEPMTAAKRALIESVGARIVVRYAVTEAGILGYGCAEGSESDDLHFLSDNLAVTSAPRPVGPEQISVDGLLITSLLPQAPKILLNVETGDYAEICERECNCPLGRAGLTSHISGIRSFEKLTGEGMTFVGTRLISILEEILPAQIGGHAGDYQLLEVEEPSGMTHVELRIDPAIGPVDKSRAVDIFFEALQRERGLRSMIEIWRQAAIVRVKRQSPLATRMGKILPFHLLKQPPPG